MRAFNRPPIVNAWAAIFIFVVLLLASLHPELNHDWHTGLLVIPLLVSYALERLLFRLEVETTEEGICTRTLFGERRMRWGQVTDVTYKPLSYHKGYTNPAWTRLHVGKTSLAYHSKLKGHEELEAEVQARLKEKTNFDLETIKAMAIDKQWLAGPSFEDLPLMFFGLGVLFGSLAFATQVLR